MKNLKFYALGLAALAGTFTACSDDDGGTDSSSSSSDKVISENITSNTTWKSGNVYTLSGRIVIEDGAELTIQPGTIIKAEGGREASASALIVARGGVIHAVGTAEEPIIFTSVLDEIEPGETESPNLDASFRGLWGGVLVLGKAPISADNSEVQIEGIPASDPNGLYGGSEEGDYSGEIAYISIRHGGTLLGEGNEINGLTLGGVGNGTSISNVEIVANLDDGIEFFGGTVNVTNAIVNGQGDDAFDVDQAYSGTVDNFVFIGSAESDHVLEIDGPEGSTNGGATLTNGTFKGYQDDEGTYGEYADFRDGAQGTYSNLYFYNFSSDSDFELDDDASSENYTNGDLKFSNLEFNVSHLSSGNLTVDAIVLDKSDLGTAFTGGLGFASIVTTATVGADVSVFSWTSSYSEL
ncbi:MAG: hypothetical protein CL843_03905 [Crocinitomicaceae bacterium]|nr:hypothetical protein [Crocinitomicaceae bacterium]|tara:strand:+ start:820 stop:2049 length:1230 start_codon:yes stop_codon:yes gene_type:complete